MSFYFIFLNNTDKNDHKYTSKQREDKPDDPDKF